jgi:hypothetical protein
VARYQSDQTISLLLQSIVCHMLSSTLSQEKFFSIQRWTRGCEGNRTLHVTCKRSIPLFENLNVVPERRLTFCVGILTYRSTASSRRRDTCLRRCPCFFDLLQGTREPRLKPTSENHAQKTHDAVERRLQRMNHLGGAPRHDDPRETVIQIDKTSSR